MKRLPALCALVALTLAACRGGVQNLPPGASSPTMDGTSAGTSVAAALSAPDRAMPLAAGGSSNTVNVELPVPHPDSKPCTVTLFTHVAFKDFNNKTFSYAPPAGCKGPWGAVVLNFNLSVSKGVQFDRTGIMWLGGGVIFFGTTAEPSPQLGPSWLVQRDVTPLSALFKNAAQGQVALGNLVNSTYTGVIYGTATLQFYPPTSSFPAPRVADAVIGIPYSPPLGGSASLPSQPMSVSTTLPRNIVAAHVSVYLQSQHNEEQWFMCVPQSVWDASHHGIGFCRNSAFREGEVSVDGTPAGTSPIYPWIYTGGLDPYLWFPIPGVQTLGFTPFDVDITPFASTLDDGAKHTIAVGVHKAYNYFTGTGNLLLYLDPKQSQVTGALVSNTLRPEPAVSEAVHMKYSTSSGIFGGLGGSGTVNLKGSHNYTISGYVNTSSGRVTTTVQVVSSFTNNQNFNVTGSEYEQAVVQDTNTFATITNASATATTVRTEAFDYPISVNYPLSKTKTGYQLPVLVQQGYRANVGVTGATPFSSGLANVVESANTLIFNGHGYVSGEQDSSSMQRYTYKDSTGICYGRALTSKNNAITSDGSPGCTPITLPPLSRKP